MSPGGPVPERPAPRPLPAHIAAQLRSTGGTEDTGGQPWAGRNLGEGTSHTHHFPEDQGQPAPAIIEALAAWRAGTADESQVVAALAGIRVFVPIVAQVSHSEITAEGLVADKEADMALVSLHAPDGRKALPVFTSVAELSAWNRHARPVAVDIRKAALSAVQDGSDLLVVDPAAAPPFVVRRPALWAVARAKSWTPSYAELSVDDAVLRAAVGLGAVVSARTEAGPGCHARRADGSTLRGGAAGPELVIVMQLEPELTDEAVRAAVATFQQRLATEPVVAQKVDSLTLRLTAQPRHSTGSAR